MIYIFDCNSFSVLKNFYPPTFPTLWDRLSLLAESGSIQSVAEVQRELKNDNRAQFILDWAKEQKEIFHKPSNEELLFVREILSVPHFQMLINQKAILKGTPAADPFVIAAAKIKNAVVVTEEELKPNAAKIPNVCKHYGIRCINLAEFMAEQSWTF